jgi:hypothetical protein
VYSFSSFGKPGDQGFCEIIDLTGEDVGDLKARLTSTMTAAPSEEKSSVRNVVVAPKSVQLEHDADLSNCLRLLTEYWPHLSTEDFPQSFSELSLQMFEQTAPCVGR